MAAAPPQDLSYRHEAILDWLILNPDKSQGDCARSLGYTEAWLSTVINSNLFRARLAMLQQEKRESGIFTIVEKLAGLADLAIDRTLKSVECSTDPAFVLSAAEIALKRLGYGPAAPPPAPSSVVNNTLVVATERGLREAVGIMRQVKAVTQESTIHNDRDIIELIPRGTLNAEATAT